MASEYVERKRSYLAWASELLPVALTSRRDAWTWDGERAGGELLTYRITLLLRIDPKWQVTSHDAKEWTCPAVVNTLSDTFPSLGYEYTRMIYVDESFPSIDRSYLCLNDNYHVALSFPKKFRSSSFDAIRHWLNGAHCAHGALRTVEFNCSLRYRHVTLTSIYSTQRWFVE